MAKFRMKIAAMHARMGIKTGAPAAFLNMMKSLKKIGHEIDIYVLNISEELRGEIETEFDVTSLDFREWRFLYFINQLRAWRQFKKLAYKINNSNYDIAFIDHFYFSPFVLPFIKIPKVYYCYEPPRTYYEPYWARYSKFKVITLVPDMIIKYLDSYCVRFADLILCPSDYSRECVWRAYGLFAVTNYLGVDTSKYRKTINIKKENIVLSVGVLRPHKGHDFTIQSIGLIPKNKRPKLVIIAAKGLTEEKERLLDLAEATSVDIEIKDYVPEETFIELHNKASVVAIAFIMEPSVEPVALAHETPIVAVREGGAREVIVNNKTGILTNRDEKEFARAIEYLLDNPKTATEMGKKGREWVRKNFTWQKCAENLEKNFDRVLASGNFPERNSQEKIVRNAHKRKLLRKNSSKIS